MSDMTISNMSRDAISMDNSQMAVHEAGQESMRGMSGLKTNEATASPEPMEMGPQTVDKSENMGSTFDMTSTGTAWDFQKAANAAMMEGMGGIANMKV